jgi:rSAM/selenodomain-associated transferase 1
MTTHFAILLTPPRAGAVDSRLAAGIGEQHALRLYRLMAGRALGAIRALRQPAVVWYAPADARQEMRRWLGEEWDLRPQASGDPGARLASAARTAVEGDRWIVVSGDCPDINETILRMASDALELYPVVLGPSLDGGYYLLGGRVPLPDLFSDMPWGTGRLLDETRRRLTRLGVAWTELPMLRSVATAQEAKAAGLLT